MLTYYIVKFLEGRDAYDPAHLGGLSTSHGAEHTVGSDNRRTNDLNEL